LCVYKGIHFNQEDILTFGIILKMRTVKHKHIIKRILTKAIDENHIEHKLKEINDVNMMVTSCPCRHISIFKIQINLFEFYSGGQQ